jgi:nicotinamidase-related amidase
LNRDGGAEMSGSAVSVDTPPKSRTVLLLVDFVNPLDFEGAQALRGPALQAAQATARLRARLDEQGVRCVYVNDNYGQWSTDFRTLWRVCSTSKDEPGRIARTLKPRSDDFTVLKPRHSGFYATPLDLLLHDLKCKRLVVTGLAADNCVFFTAMDAYLRGYSLWIPDDCVAAETAQAKEFAMSHMSRVLKASVQAAGDGAPTRDERTPAR